MNREKYNKIFIETLSVTDVQLSGLAYQSVPLWDSVGHMAIIAALEETFDIMMDTDDIIALSDYETGMKILSTNYNISF